MFKRLLGVAITLASPITLIPVYASLVVPTAAAEAKAPYCGSDSYINSRGHCVPRPRRSNSVPAGATAKCRDGTYSFSESRRGTCSYHGGVAQWLLN